MAGNYLAHLGISIETGDAEASLKKLEGALSSTAGSAERIGTSAGRSAAPGLDQVDRSARAAFASTERLSSGLVTLVRSTVEVLALGAAFHKILDMADQFKSLSLQLGVTTQFVQEMGYAFRISGQDASSLVMAERQLSQQLTAAAEGNKKAAQSFNQLHLNASELLKLPFDQQLEIVVSRLSGMGNETEKTALAADLLSRSSKGLLAVMRDHGGTLESVRAEAHKYGQVLSEEVINRLDELGDALGTAGRAWLNWAGQAGGSVQIVIDWLKELATWPAKIQRMWEGMWTAIQSVDAQMFAQEQKKHSDAAIEALRTREKEYQDKIGALARSVNETPMFAPADWKAQMDTYAKQISAIEGMIAARQRDTDTAMANVGAVKTLADTHAREAAMESAASEQIRRAALEESRAKVEGYTAIAEGAKKASEAGENFMAQLDAEIALLKANYDESFRLEAIKHKVAESDLDAAVAKQKYIEDLKLEKKFTEDITKANEDQAKALMTLDDSIKIQRDQMFMANDERERENQLRQAGLAAGTADYEMRYKEIAALQDTQHQLELMKDIGSTIKEGFLTTFEAIFSKGKAGFADLFDSIKSWFIKLLAQLALMAAANPIRIVLTAAGGLLGMDSASASAGAQSIISGMMPYGNLLGTGMNLAGINPTQYISSLFPGSASTSSIFGNSLTPASGAGGFGGMLSTALPYLGAGLGGWGLGGMAAGWTGGNPLGGNIGGFLGGIGGYTLGGMAGTALGIGGGAASGALMGSVVPIIGTIIGAILGGILGGLFGGKEKPNPFNVSLGTGKEFPISTRPTIKGYEDYTSVPGPFGDIGFILRGNNDKFDAASESAKKFLEGIAQIDQAFSQFLNPQEIETVKNRLKNMNEIEFKDSFSAVKAMKQRFEEMLDAVDPKLRTLYDSFNITADNAGTFALALLNLRKEMGDLDTAIRALSGQNNPVQQFLDNISALDAAMMSAAKAGQEAIASGDPEKVLQAEQALKQSIVARYQYEMDIATQLNSVIEGLKASIAQLKEQAYQLAVSQYKDWLSINQRIQATGGGGVAQLDIYRSAGADLLGAYNRTTDPAKRLEMIRQGVEIVDQGLALAMSDIDKWAQGEHAARQTQIDALNKEKAAIQSVAQVRIDGLSKELAAAQKWAGILSQAQGALDQLRYGGTNPLSSFARLQSVRGDLSGETDPARRIQLLQTMMSLGGESWQRPSREYQTIYNQVVSGLSGMRNEAARQAAHATDLQEEIARASTQGNDKLASIDNQIAALQDMSDIDRRVEQLQREANAEAATYYLWLRNEGAKTYDALNSGLNDQIAAQEQALSIAQGQMDALTAGLGYTAFMAERQSEMVALLTDIRNVLAELYSGQVTRTQVTQITPEQIRALIPYIRQQLKVA